jgi:hypothetical protein
MLEYESGSPCSPVLSLTLSVQFILRSFGIIGCELGLASARGSGIFVLRRCRVTCRMSPRAVTRIVESYEHMSKNHWTPSRQRAHHFYAGLTGINVYFFPRSAWLTDCQSSSLRLRLKRSRFTRRCRRASLSISRKAKLAGTGR